MIYLLLAITCSVTISVLMKNRRKIVKNEIAMFMANYVVCILLSYHYSGNIVVSKDSSFSIILGVVSGFLYLYSFTISDKNVAKNGMIMSSTFGKLGVLVPTFLSFVLFAQKLNLTQSVGFVMAIFAIILIYFEKDGLSLITSRSFLIFYMFVAGITDSTIALYDHYGSPVFKNQFLLINFFFAFVFSIIFLFFKKEKISYKELLYGAAIGIPNYYSSRFLMYSLETVPSIIAYPFSSIGGMLCISLIGSLIFKEKLSPKKIIALCIIVCALVLLNF